MNPKVLAVATLLIGLAGGMAIGTFALGPLIVKPSTGSNSANGNCQPETVVLSSMHSYNGFWVANVQNAGPGTVTLAKYGVYANNSGFSSPPYPTDSYIYNSTSFNAPTTNPVIASGVTLGVNAYLGSGWKLGYTIVTIITSCGNKWSAPIGY